MTTFTRNMSTNFSSNQFEGSFLPHKLQNYELPHRFKQHPSPRRGQTQIISNDRGHILSKNRRSIINPWGHFIGTWQTPHKPVQLKVKTKIMSQQQRPVSAPASIVSQKDGRPSSQQSSSEVGSKPQTPLETIKETERQGSSHSTNRSGTAETSHPSSAARKSPPKCSHRDSSQPGSLPPTPGQHAFNDSPVNRPSAPTPSQLSGNQSVSEAHSIKHTPSTVRSSQQLASPNNGSVIPSRASSAPPTRLSGLTPPTEALSRDSTTAGSGSTYRPHSRQVSREGSGIGTSHGLKVYTPLSTAGDHSQNTGSSTGARKSKGVQCPSAS